MKKVWYVKFPTFKYVEDVKEIARKNDLMIIDAQYQDGDAQCKNAPKLTLKDDAKSEAKGK